jgi:chromosome segregation ATPase
MTLPNNLSIPEFLRFADDLTPVSQWRSKLESAIDIYEEKLKEYEEYNHELQADLDEVKDELKDLKHNMTIIRKALKEATDAAT